MTARLTQEHRAKIERAVEADVLGKRQADLDDREHQLAEDILNHALGDKAELFHSLPRGWCDTHRRIVFAYGDSVVGRAEFKTHKCMPPRWAQGVAACILPKSHPLTKRYIRLTAARRRFKDDTPNLTRELTAVLASCRTAKQFVEAWPNGAKYVPEEWLKPGTALIPNAERLDEVVNQLRKAA